MVKVKAIIFDMDGVLIHAKDWHYEALNEALKDYGYVPIEYEDHLENFDGLPTRKKLRLLSQRQGIPEEQFEEINACKQRHTQEVAKKRCGPTQYHIDALSRLKDDGYRLALCSNSVRGSIDLMMDKAELTEYLEFSLSYEDVGNPKPDPEIYITAIEKLELDPLECLILEDNKNGIKAALGSGAHLLKIDEISDVTYENIMSKINEIESEEAPCQESM